MNVNVNASMNMNMNMTENMNTYIHMNMKNYMNMKLISEYEYDPGSGRFGLSTARKCEI